MIGLKNVNCYISEAFFNNHYIFFLIVTIFYKRRELTLKWKKKDARELSMSTIHDVIHKVQSLSKN